MAVSFDTPPSLLPKVNVPDFVPELAPDHVPAGVELCVNVHPVKDLVFCSEYSPFDTL